MSCRPCCVRHPASRKKEIPEGNVIRNFPPPREFEEWGTKIKRILGCTINHYVTEREK